MTLPRPELVNAQISHLAKAADELGVIDRSLARMVAASDEPAP